MSNNSLGFWDKMELDTTELHRCEQTHISPGISISTTFWQWSPATLLPVNKRFVSILYFETVDKLIDRIADHF